MADMICENCGKHGIYWKNLHTIGSVVEKHYTYCPHCEGTNCQQEQEEKQISTAPPCQRVRRRNR